jgi:hypothetical protein
MISSDLTSTYFDMYAFIIRALPPSRDDSDVITMIGKHWARSFYWIPKYVFDQNIGFKVIDPILFPKYTAKSDKVLLLMDRSVLSEIRDKEKQEDYINQIRVWYDNSSLKQRFRENWTEPDSAASSYPYASIDSILGSIGRLDIRTNY